MQASAIARPPLTGPLGRGARTRETATRPILLVCSSGGHLAELYRIKDGWPQAARHWVTFPTIDARSMLAGERLTFCHHPTNRNVRNAARNLLLAARVVRRLRPSAVVTNGAGVAVPFCYVARALGIRVIYIECSARVLTISLSGRLIHPVAHQFFVQWPELEHSCSKAQYVGQLL